MKKILAALFVVSIASFTLLGITSTAAEDDPCENAMKQALTERLADKPYPPIGRACDGVTDARWMTINAQLEPLHNALTAE